MKHNFKFQLGQAVRVLDYDDPRTEHYAAVTRQWLEAYRGNEDPDALEEKYEVELKFNGKKQLSVFSVDDITEDVHDSYWKLTIGHAKNHWLKKRKDKDVAALQRLAYGHGFPADDECSLHQFAGHGEANLSIYYAYQYVQEEKLEWNERKYCYGARLSKSHILPGSIVIEYDGELCNDDKRMAVRTKSGKPIAVVDYKHGNIFSVRREKLGTISYEYDCDKHNES